MEVSIHMQKHMSTRMPKRISMGTTIHMSCALLYLNVYARAFACLEVPFNGASYAHVHAHVYTLVCEHTSIHVSQRYQTSLREEAWCGLCFTFLFWRGFTFFNFEGKTYDDQERCCTCKPKEIKKVCVHIRLQVICNHRCGLSLFEPLQYPDIA